jgi:non-ribosomal peptide synthetase component F
VSDETESLAYVELDARANQIARRLVAAGIAPRGRVAIAMDRTAMTVAAMIGVWRAGCAYVPLDMTMPPARLRQILDGAGIAAILSDGASRTVLEAGEHRVLELEALLAESDDEDVALPIVSDADSAYVIFTSGSTGKPKGVEIGHRALSNFLLSMAQAPGFDGAGQHCRGHHVLLRYLRSRAVPAAHRRWPDLHRRLCRGPHRLRVGDPAEGAGRHRSAGNAIALAHAVGGRLQGTEGLQDPVRR